MILIRRCLVCGKIVGWKFSRQLRWGTTSTTCGRCLVLQLVERGRKMRGQIKELEAEIGTLKNRGASL